jgi:hypothetical protein
MYPSKTTCDSIARDTPEVNLVVIQHNLVMGFLPPTNHRSDNDGAPMFWPLVALHLQHHKNEEVLMFISFILLVERQISIVSTHLQFLVLLSG